MGHYISAFCPTHGDVDCDDGNAFCDDCYEVTPKGALTAAQARIEKLERMVIWVLERSGVVELDESCPGKLWNGRDKYIDHDGTAPSILAAVEKAMGE